MRTFTHVLLAAAVAACGAPPVEPAPEAPPPPSGVASLEAGDKSMGPLADTVGATMRQPLVVIVLDSLGVPIRGVAVRWEASDGATVSDAIMPTDAGGESIVSLTLGTITGGYRARASVPGFSGPAIEFVATAHPATPVRIEKANGDGLEVFAGGRVVYTVRARDSFGNGVHGVLVEWTALDNGSLSWTSGYTSKGGFAEVTAKTAWSGPQLRVSARAPDLPGSPTLIFFTSVRPTVASADAKPR